mgnify:CR=1 FL=1
MKKRLLSAALALAMVLTLMPVSVLPVSAAATTPDGTQMGEQQEGMTVTWYGTEHTYGKDNAGNDVTSTNPGYYAWDANARTLYHAASGVIEGLSAAGGRWHPNAYTSNGTATHMLSSFTLVGNTTVSRSGTAYAQSSISVNLNNHSLTISDGFNESNGTKFSNLTVTNTPVTGAVNKGASVTLPTAWSNLTDRSINLSVTNATVTGSISVSQATGTNTNYGITATTVNNAVLPSLTVTDGPMSLRLTNQSEVGNVTVTSGKPTTASITLEDSKANQGIAVSVPSGGTINVGTSGTRGTVTGEVSLTNTSSTASGGTITAYNANLGGVVLNGIGTKLSATNCTISGTVAVTGNGPFQGAPTLDQTAKDRAALPTVEIHGGNVSDGGNNTAAIRNGYDEQLTGASPSTATPRWVLSAWATPRST